MSSIGTGYDLYTTTFSPDGRVFQVEYAGKAVENSGTVLGIKCKDGIVFAVEKLLTQKMFVRKSNTRIFSLDRHAGMAIAGHFPDGRPLVNRGRAEARQYKQTFGDQIPCKVLCDRLAGFMHAYTLYWYVRPFGVSMLVGSYDHDGPHLQCIDPSGQTLSYNAYAIGKARQLAKTELEKLLKEELTCREAIPALAKVIYHVHDDVKDKDFELEMSWVCDESNRIHQFVPADLKAEAEAAAKAALDEDLSDDDA
eukprot:Rmarinus@m.22944